VPAAARRALCVTRATNGDAQGEKIKSTLADLDALLGIQEEPAKTSTDKVSVRAFDVCKWSGFA